MGQTEINCFRWVIWPEFLLSFANRLSILGSLGLNNTRSKCRVRRPFVLDGDREERVSFGPFAGITSRLWSAIHAISRVFIRGYGRW